MDNWVIWFLLAGIMVILEVFTGTFYLLMVAVGIAAGGAAALAGFGPSLQLVIAGIVGVVATDLLRRTKLGKIELGNASRDRNVNLDIGQSLDIDEWKGSGNQQTARVMYRGAMWDIELEQGASALPGKFTICEVRGSCLIVTNQTSNNKSQGENSHGT